MPKIICEFQPRRELYQLKNEAEHKKYLAKKVANMIEEFNWKGSRIPKYIAVWKAVWDNYE